MQDRVTGRPPEPEPWGDSPPWEQPRAFRLDCEPHRARLLWWLSFGALLIGLFSFGGVLVLFCGPVAVGMGLIVRAMALRDLAQMRRGMIDPSGTAWTEEARKLGGMAVGMALGAAVFWGLLFWWLLP